jgi:hypothetical protein
MPHACLSAAASKHHVRTWTNYFSLGLQQLMARGYGSNVGFYSVLIALQNTVPIPLLTHKLSVKSNRVRLNAQTRTNHHHDWYGHQFSLIKMPCTFDTKILALSSLI